MSIYGTKRHIEKWYQTSTQVLGAAAADPITGTAVVQLKTLDDTRDGISNPNWKQQVAQGHNATTPFTGVLQRLECDPAVSEIWWLATFPDTPANWRRERKTWSHDVGGLFPTAPPINDLNTAKNRAQTKFYKELENALTSFQGGVALGELRETLQLIRNPAKTLRRKIDDYFSSAKKRRRGSSITKEKVLADMWLEHSFGWLPLLHDLDSARKYHKNRVKQLKQELIKLQGTSVFESVTDTFVGDNGGMYHLGARLVTQNRSFARYSGAVASEALGDRVINASAMGLAPRSFAPTIWELFPWSFAVDYFTNVGDVIAAWANQKTRLAWCCETTRREQRMRSYGTYFTGYTANPAKVYFTSLVGGHSEASYKIVGRAPSSYCPVPSIQFEIPGFGRKWLNLAALAANRRALTPY
jgi:hypothetical protein